MVITLPPRPPLKKKKPKKTKTNEQAVRIDQLGMEEH